MAVVALASCTILGRPDAEVILDTSLEPDVAAWLAAQACRAEHPGADPLPLHPGAPIVRDGEGDYRILYNRSPPHGYRVATNGRLLGPETPAVSPGGQALTLSPVSFLTAARWTGLRNSGPDEVSIRIQASVAGSRLTVRLSGAAAEGTLPQHLEQVLALGEAIEETATMVERRQWGIARDRASEALSRFGPGCCGRHQTLRTRLLVHLASAEQAQGQLDAARAAIARGLGLPEEIPGLRLWQARLDQRLALDQQAATDWHILAASPSGDGFSGAAAGQLRAALRRLLQLTPGLDYRDRAHTLLRQSDVAGARSQLDMARSMDPMPETDLDGLTRWHRQQGRHRAAFEVALQRLELGEDPATILALCELCADTDQPVLALHLMARHWNDLIEHDRAATESWFRLHADRAGVNIATRTLTAEGALPLAQEVLSLWMRSGRATLAAAEDLAMVWWLRDEEPARPERIPGVDDLDYECAPGVRSPR